MLETLLKKFVHYNNTCSITNVKDGCVTFMRHYKYGQQLEDINEDIWVITPLDFAGSVGSHVKIYRTAYPEYEFTIYHNYIHKNDPVPEPTVGNGCIIHPTVVMNVEGVKVVYKNHTKVQFIHTGDIIIKDNVEIGAYSVIHRGTMGPTIINKGVKIGAKTNIAHNNIIGEDTVFAVGAITNGSVSIGKNCWISSGALIRNSVSICDNVVVGLGAVVVKDIIKSGIYVGNPAKYLKPVPEGWNF